MNRQDYLDELEADGREFIEENIEYYDDFSDCWDEMSLQITGNDNGSYYCNSLQAKEAISDAMWDESVVDAVRELGYDGIPTDKGPEAVDVIIRYSLLQELYSELEDYFDELKEEDEEEEDEDEDDN